MKKLLSYLGLIATLLAIPNLSKADDQFKYYLIGNINNWDKSGCMTDTYFFGQSSNPKDAVPWSKDFSGEDLLKNVSGTTAYFKIWVKQTYNGNESNGNAQYYLTCTGSNNTKVNIDGNTVYINAFNDDADNVCLYIDGVQASHTYRITFVSGTGNENDNSRKKGTIKVEDLGSNFTTSSVYLLGTINSWGNNGNNGTDYPLSLDNGEYKLNLTKAQVQSALYADDFYFRFTENMSNGDTYNVAPSSEGTSITVDAAYTSANASTSSTDNYWKFTPTGAANYTIYFKNNNGTRQVRVVDDIEPLYLHSNLTSQWNGSNNTPLTYNSSTGYYEKTLTESEINGAYNDDLRFRIGDVTSSWQPSATYAFSKRGTEVHDLTSTGTSNYLSIPKNIKSAKIQAKKVTENNTTKIVVYVSLNYFYYYWVSPEITNGEMWPSFRMEPSRNRYWSGSAVIGDGKISMKYFTFTIKDDDLVTWKTKKKIGDNKQIKWWIVRDDGEVVYRPKDDLAVGYKPHSGNPYDNDHPITGKLDDYVCFINYWNGSSYDGETAYKNVSTGDNDGSWSFAKGSYKAYTFNLNAEKGHVLYNYTTTGATIDDNGYDLAGNWSTGVEVSISLNANDTKPMTKYWYKGKNSYKSLEAYQTAVGDISSNPADSIVYKVNVDRPSGGWGGLYLVVFPNSLSRNWDKHPAVLRPLITMGNDLDGRALHGALTTSNSEQSLNPEPESYYTGYTFSFNATTMTYRLEFHMPDATLSPGTEDGNLDFKTTTSENITVKRTDGTDGIHSEAVNYAIGFGTDANFVLNESTKYTDASFNLTYDGTSNSITYTSSDNNFSGTISNSNTIYVKVRGYDGAAIPNYGDIHTYQYSFHSKISCTPNSGLFINSAKLNITGGTPPYRYEIWYYPTKVENGEEVIDYTSASAAKLSEGTFSTGTYENSENNYRISTPGFLKITDSASPTPNSVTYAEVGGGFDFTYSTSENYIRNTGGAITTINANDAGAYPNGADYWLARPDDLTRLVKPTSNSANWSYASGPQSTTGGSHWSGDNTINYLHLQSNTASQTINNLDAGTYTVQAIVRGGAVPVHLKLNSDEEVSITLTGDGDGAMSTISPVGRCEQLENRMTKGWQKLEASTTLSAPGSLTIAVRAEGGIDLADVILLKDANTTTGFRTTASTSPTDITTYDYRRRQVSGSPSQRQNNAYSFFDRGKNQNAVIFANENTVIAMNSALLADDAQNTKLKATDRRHPFNVVACGEDDSKLGTAKALYLSDSGYDGSYLPVELGTSGDANYNSENYRTRGYSFCPGLAFYAEDLIFDRNMSQAAAKKTTCMLPISITPGALKTYFGDDLKVYKFTSLSGKDLTFTQQTDATVLNANEPYIYWGAEGKLDTRGKTAGKTDGKFEVAQTTSTDHNAAASHSGFPGTYAYKKLTRYGKADGTGTSDVSQAAETRFIYSASKGVFSVVSTNGANLKPFRAYFVLPVTDATATPAPLNVIFDDEVVVTGIDNVESTEAPRGDVYTVSGMLVAKDGDLSRLAKGIYIVNGKKYVVK